jgi:hypothetical protein
MMKVAARISELFKRCKTKNDIPNNPVSKKKRSSQRSLAFAGDWTGLERLKNQITP